MAYTIRIPLDQEALKEHHLPTTNVTLAPAVTIDKLGIDISGLMHKHYNLGDWKTHYTKAKKLGSVFVIEMRNIRLKEDARKAYCGQHAGPCVAARPRRRDGSPRPLPKSCYLESADWIKLHNMINVVLDLHQVKAEVFSTRVDMFHAVGCSKNKFLIRSPDLGGRKRYDYIDGAGPNAFRPHYLFDPGQPCQFGEHLSYGDEADVSELRQVARVDSWKNQVVATH